MTTTLTRASIAARLTGDRGQALTPLSWWPAMDAALDDPEARVVLVWAARQTGKSQALMRRAIEDVLLVPNSYTLFISAGREQADVNYERKLRRPLLRLARAAGQTIKTTKRGVENTALNSAVEVVAANEVTVPGRSVTLLVIDEGRHVPDEVFAALAPSVIAAGGKILVASTAGPPTGFFHTLATGSDPEVRVVHVASNENPYADPKIIGFLSRLLRRILPSAAARDLDNTFAEDGDEFFSAPLIEAAVDDALGEVSSSDREAFAFLDLSRRRDLTSRVVVLRDTPRRPEAPDHLVTASVRTWNPAQSPTGETPFEEVRADVASLPRRFPNLRAVLIDSGAEVGAVGPWARTQPELALLIQEFIATPEANMKLWGALAARLHGGTLSIPRHARLLAELRSLRAESFALGSKWRVVDSSRRLHRDVSLGLAGAVYAAGERVLCTECDELGCQGYHVSILGAPPRSYRRRAEPEGPTPGSLPALLADAVEPEADEVFADPSLDVIVGLAQDAQESAAVVVIRDADVVVLLRHRVWSGAVPDAEVAAQVRAWAGEFHVVEIRGDVTARGVLALVRNVAPMVGERGVAGGTLVEHLGKREVVLYQAAGVEAAAERAEHEPTWPPMLRALTVAVLAAFARPEEARR
ncbi:MAG: hypothetical protein HY729_05110 [Candidatus Rokubacteria bacterium]|nr:hypothetical protein [Candidatus Rokubacteria bacterium]